MKYHTIEGKTYCVVGTADGTVTSASGVVIASFSANEQSYFTAPAGGFVTISDDTAIVTPVFDSAPSALGGKSGGGGSSSFDMEAYNAFYGKYVTCTTVGEVSAINSDYKNDLTSWGEWVYKLSNLTNGSQMFYYCSNLTEWNTPLPNLTNGYTMFNSCTKLTSFSGDLSSLTSGNSMFQNCSLKDWNTPLSALTSGDSMFQDCTKLTSWNTPLPKMTNGSYMFQNCKKLTSWTIDLSALTNGDRMFNQCTNLTSFSSDLSALAIGSYMFSGCKLDAASVERILSTIPTYTDSSTHELLLHFSSEAAAKFEEITGLTPTTSEQRVSYKGWTISAAIMQ